MKSERSLKKCMWKEEVVNNVKYHEIVVLHFIHRSLVVHLKKSFDISLAFDKEEGKFRNLCRAKYFVKYIFRKK